MATLFNTATKVKKKWKFPPARFPLISHTSLTHSSLIPANIFHVKSNCFLYHTRLGHIWFPLLLHRGGRGLWEFGVAKCLLDCVGKQFWQMAERRRHYSKCHVSASKELENRRAAHGGGKEMSTRVHQSNELSLLCLSLSLEWEVSASRECVWAWGSRFAMCLPFEWDTTLVSLIFLSSPCPDPHFHEHVTDVYKWATPGIAKFGLRWPTIK